MKTIKFFMVALISLVTATTCFADDRMILPEQLPAAAKTFIQTHYSGAKILFASKDLDGLSKHYEVHLNDGTQLDFDSKGNWTSWKATGGYGAWHITRTITYYTDEEVKAATAELEQARKGATQDNGQKKEDLWEF